jgi:DNA-binding YbaB/EbfC family protein
VENLNNLEQLFQLGQQMQSKMEDLQQRLEQESVTADSGGGMVRVTADGKGNVREIKLDPTVVDPQDVEMLEDLVLAAVSEVQRKARERLEEEMRQAAGGFPLGGLPGMMG